MKGYSCSDDSTVVQLRLSIEAYSGSGVTWLLEEQDFSSTGSMRGPWISALLRRDICSALFRWLWIRFRCSL